MYEGVARTRDDGLTGLAISVRGVSGGMAWRQTSEIKSAFRRLN